MRTLWSVIAGLAFSVLSLCHAPAATLTEPPIVNPVPPFPEVIVNWDLTLGAPGLPFSYLAIDLGLTAKFFFTIYTELNGHGEVFGTFDGDATGLPSTIIEFFGHGSNNGPILDGVFSIGFRVQDFAGMVHIGAASGVRDAIRSPMVDAPAVPEPGTLSLLMLGLGGLAAIQRIRRSEREDLNLHLRPGWSALGRLSFARVCSRKGWNRGDVTSGSRRGVAGVVSDLG